MRISLISLFILIGTVLLGQSDNPFLNRAYWKENPSIEQVAEEIEKGNDPSEFNEYKFDAVTWAIIQRVSHQTIWFLLDQEGNGVNKRSHDGRTPIFWAAYRGDVQFMKELIEKGAKTDLIDDHGYSLVNFAATTGQLNLDLYDLCIENGAKLETEKNRDGATPLLLLIPHLKDPKKIKYFEEKGLSLNQLDKFGNNAFVYAAKTGNKKLMEYLIKYGIDPKINNSAAVIFACKGTRGTTNSVETYQYLKSLGLSMTETDSKGKTALHYLSSNCEDIDVFNFFIKHGVQLSEKDKKGNMPFLNAVSRNSREIVQFLAENTKNINGKNNKSENALHLAVKRNNLDILEILLSQNIDINAKNENGLTPLHLAAMTAKDDSIIKKLVEAGADKQLLTPFEETAFDLANENELLTQERISLDFLK
ncbi:MAG: ankyrin repeat domain-containing protein [Crocinitomicaceae bacterium]|nr:ankyrin repeat domain-containing protein [Crocinitomicaceae bacterium]